jgi:hypothetical protein
MISKADIEEQIQFASDIVGQWPAWKRNILVHSLQPMNSKPRSPVDNRHASNIDFTPVLRPAPHGAKCSAQCAKG